MLTSNPQPAVDNEFPQQFYCSLLVLLRLFPSMVSTETCVIRVLTRPKRLVYCILHDLTLPV